MLFGMSLPGGLPSLTSVPLQKDLGNDINRNFELKAYENCNAASYEKAKEHMSSALKVQSPQELPAWAFASTSGGAAAFAAGLTHPIDVVKTRFQVLSISRKKKTDCCQAYIDQACILYHLLQLKAGRKMQGFLKDCHHVYLIG